MQYDYHTPPAATFGADPPGVSSGLANVLTRAQLLTPQWFRESLTITIGVFGALTLFRIFQKRLPKA